MNLDQMWEQLAAHQPIADERGYGGVWRQMCEERSSAVCQTVFDKLWVLAKDMDSMPIRRAAYAAWTAGESMSSIKLVKTLLQKAT